MISKLKENLDFTNKNSIIVIYKIRTVMRKVGNELLKEMISIYAES